MSQKDHIARLLHTGPVCGTRLLELRMPRYAARIAELRDSGLNIETRRCQNPNHFHQSKQVEYVLHNDRLFV